MIDTGKLLTDADRRLKKMCEEAHRTAGEGKGLKALGYYAAIKLCRDSYEMGMRDALKAIECVHGEKLEGQQ